MEKDDIKPDIHIYKVLIYEYYKRKNFKMIIDIYESIEDDDKNGLSVFSNNFVLKSYGELHKTRKFISLFDSMEIKT